MNLELSRRQYRLMIMGFAGTTVKSQSSNGEPVKVQRKKDPQQCSTLSFSWFGLLGEIWGRSVTLVDINVTIWTDVKLVHLLSSLSLKYRRQAVHSCQQGAVDFLNHNWFCCLCLFLLQMYPPKIFSLCTVKFNPLITILAVIVHSTKADDASLPFMIRRSLLLHPLATSIKFRGHFVLALKSLWLPPGA